MGLFKKQETIVQNMVYMGLLAAVNVVFVLLTYFVPFLLFVLVFVLPLCSVIITYYCKKYYFPIYFIVVTAICLLIDLPDTIFYVIPSLITGFIFGLFIDIKIQPIFSIIIATVVQFGISLAFIPLIKVLTDRDIIYDMAKIFHLVDYEYLNYVVVSFVFFVAFAQVMISYMVMHSELSKFGVSFSKDTKNIFILDLISIGCSLLMILFAFVYPLLSFVFLMLSFIVTIDRLIYLDFEHYKLYIVELVIISLGTIFFVALIYNMIPSPLGLLLIGFLPFMISCACLLNKSLLSKRSKDTINNWYDVRFEKRR